MNMIVKLSAGALITGMAIAAAGCAKSGASTHTAGAAAASAPAAPISSPPQQTEDKMPRISVEEARKLVAEGTAVIIDVRGPDAYKISHIKGALDVSLSKLQTGNFEELPKDKRIIAYCA